MTVAAPNIDEQVMLADKPRSLWRDAWGRLRHNRTALVCAGIVTVYLLIAVIGFTPLLSERQARVYGKSYEPPTWRDAKGAVNPSVWLGTDFLGRSVLWRMLYGARIALTVAVLAALLEVFIGVSLGALAGYFGGILDMFVVWLFTTVSSIPGILMIVALAYALQDRAPSVTIFGHQYTLPLKGVPTIVLALGLTSWVGLCRLIRAEVLKHRERDYVIAGRAMGLSHARIIFRHVLPNVFHLIIINFSLALAAFVLLEVVLSFLGLGVTNQPSWGRMIDDAKLELLKGVWWQMAAATVAIFIFSLAINLLGDALRDALDPKLRGVD